MKKIKNSIIIFKDLFDINRIQKLQDAFASATGVASIITDPDGKAITRPSNFTRFCRDIVKKTERGCSNCRHSDVITEKAIASPDADGPVITNCLSAGLWDAGAGIYLGERHIANWLIGQVRDVETDDSKFLSYAHEIGVDEDTFMEALAEVTSMKRTQFENVCKTLYLMTKQLSELAFRNEALSREMEARKSVEEERRKIEAQMMNTQKLESLGVLAGGIAHDFNNMLMVILGYADLALTSNPAGTQTHRQLLEIKKVARQGGDLCNQMLAYSGRGQFVIENININEMIHEIAQMLSMTVSKSTVLRYELANDLCSIQGDLSQLRQVVMNLVTNASDAIHEGQGLITVSTSVSGRSQIKELGSLIKGDLSSEKYVLLEVTDTGCGMNKMTINKIFDPFFTTKSTGRGLGMAVVLGIVSGHKGTIKVDSQPGEGSKFRLFFPAASDESTC
ncbi:MAG: PocR ligand-binding domain-containing protein [Candidatus Aegiribacteria sp.]|nr:PocR ligand-binding domain-containing protein [Candidatus Aegiribacteria sp.]